MSTPERIAEVLRDCQPTYTDERGLHDALESALIAAGMDVQREVRLSPRDRVDLMVGTTAIEIKVAGSWENVYRQLLRYSRHSDVEALILVTTKRQHIVHIPAEINRLGPVPILFVLKGGMF